ncbi:MAG: M13 family metallopeptidase [Aminipila sp.]
MGLNNLRKKYSKGRIAYIIAISMIFSATFTTSVFADEKFLSRGDAAALIYKAALSYNRDISRVQILKGYEDGKLEEKKDVNRIEAYAMISRAFGDLDTPKGNNLRTGVFNVVFNDLPEWAHKEVYNLESAGLITEKSKNQMGANDSITNTELKKMIQRVYTYIGTNQKDNLYTKVNSKWLDDSKIPSGYIGLSAFDELELKNKQKLNGIIGDAIKARGEKGSKEQKIADFYSTASDMENRNKQGILPIKKYIDLANGSKTMDELFQVDALLDKETGISVLTPWSVDADAKNSTKYAVYYSGAVLSLDKESYIKENEELSNALIKTIAQYLVLAGEEENKAKSLAEKIYRFEKDLAFYDLNNQEIHNVNKTYNPYTKKEFVRLFKGIDMNKILDDLGLENTKKIIVVKKDLTLRVAELLNDKNLEIWKAIFKYKIINSFSGVLSEEVSDVGFELSKVYTGNTEKLSFQEKAVDLTTSFVSTPIEQIYVSKYFSKTAKSDVEKMVDMFIKTYEGRIRNNTWLSEATKDKAIKKLRKMTVKIGYPDKWPDTIDKVQISTYKDGGSLFENVTEIMSINNREIKDKIGKKVDRNAWGMNVYQVNAYYNPLANEIVFPAGILQAPFYDEYFDKEKNLGGIGTVIAHEITHAFDNNGASYDENGNANNWWTATDYKNFEKKCKQVIKLYDKVEVAPGIENNGELTVSENVADLGGLACALEVADKLDKPNYKLLLDNFTTIFRVTRNRTSLEYYTKTDVHSNGMIRVNQAVKNFEQFYKTYNVVEGDGMYIPPEDRITIW